MQKQKKLSARILSLVLTAAMVGTIATVFAAPAAAAGESCYEAITIAPGSLNGNTVWGVTEALDSSIRLDTGALFYAKMSDRNGGTGGLPIDGNLTTATEHVPYQFASGSDPAKAYDGNDAIHLKASHTSQTMALQTIGAYEKIYVLATAGGPGKGNYAEFKVTLTYTDKTTQDVTYKLYDWYDTTKVTDVEQVAGLWRISPTGSTPVYQQDNTLPIMHSATIKADSSKLLSSISFTMLKQGGKDGDTNMNNLYCGIYAVTGAISANAPAQPKALPATHVGSNGFTANWTKVDNADNYRLDISELENFTTLLPKYNNKVVTGTVTGNTVSFDVTGLESNTTYYYRVRAVNTSGQSLGSYRIATDLPQWVRNAGLSSANATYDVETGALKLKEGVTLTAPLVIPADGAARSLDLNGQSLTAANGQPVIKASNGKVEFTLKDTSTSSSSPTLVGGDGQPAIDFSNAAAGSAVTLSGGASVQGGNGTTGKGGDGIKGNSNTTIVVGKDSAATGGVGGAGDNGGTGNSGGNGVTGGSVTINGSVTGGTGGNNITGTGGTGGVGASGTHIINGGGTAAGGGGGGGTIGGAGGEGIVGIKETGSTLTATAGTAGSSKTLIVISGLGTPASTKVYDGIAIKDSVFGTATFTPTWDGTPEYNYYSVASDGTETLLLGAPKDAGSYKVKIAIPRADLTSRGEATVTFTIGQAPLTITAIDKFTYQYKELPATELAYAGFIAGEDKAVLGTNAYAAVHTAKDTKTKGEFAIDVSGSTTNPNYHITPTSGKLTIQAVSPPKPANTAPPTTTVTKPEIVAEPTAPANPNDPAKQLRVFSGNLAPEDETEALKRLTVPAGGVTTKQEVELQVSNDGGTTWKKATTADVKEGKIQVVLPIPDKTSPATHTYIIYHFADGATKAPISLNPIVSTQTNSLSATVSSLSPFVAVATPKGGGSGTTTYPNTVNKPQNGTVTTNPASPSKGQTVTITTKPDAGYVVDTIIVKDADGKTIAVTKNGENSYTFVQPGSKATVEVTYKKPGTKTFTDVTANDWFYNAVMAATANGWFSGTSATTFDPYASTTRGMIAAVLQRVDSTPRATTASFDDVAADAYYASGIAWAQANNIVAGYGDGNYGPNDSITREQLAAILYRYAGYKGYDVSKRATLDSFTDGKSVSGYAKESMSWAVGSGLISGRGNNILAPTAVATRAEVAVTLVLFDELFTK